MNFEIWNRGCSLLYAHTTSFSSNLTFYIFCFMKLNYTCVYSPSTHLWTVLPCLIFCDPCAYQNVSEYSKICQWYILHLNRLSDDKKMSGKRQDDTEMSLNWNTTIEVTNTWCLWNIFGVCYWRLLPLIHLKAGLDKWSLSMYFLKI